MSLAEEIEKLQRLHDTGALTAEEFQQAKTRLLGTGPKPADPEREARQWAFILHLSQYAHLVFPLGGLLLPIILWQLKKDTHPAVDTHGKNIVNWGISLLIYLAVAIPLCFLLIGIPVVVLLTLAALILPLIGAIKANNDEVWAYPGAITFIR